MNTKTPEDLRHLAAAGSIDWTQDHEGKRTSDDVLYNVMDGPFNSVHQFRRNGLSLAGADCVSQERMVKRWPHIWWNWDLVEFDPGVMTRMENRATDLLNDYGLMHRCHGPMSMLEFLQGGATRHPDFKWSQYNVIDFDWTGIHSEANIRCFQLVFERNLLAPDGFIINTSGLGHAQPKSAAHQSCLSHVTRRRVRVDDLRINKWPLPEGATAKIHGFANLIETISKTGGSPVKAVRATLYSSGKYNHAQVHHLFQRV